MKTFLNKLLKNFVLVYSWPYLPWHLVAIVATYFLVTLGLDWYYFSLTRSLDISWLWVPAGILGGLLPILIPAVLFVIAKYHKDQDLFSKSLVLAQAAMLGWLVSSIYKVFTGRIPPDLTNSAIDTSHGFRFGFWEGGIFWGWPSSHTTVAFAMVISFLVLGSVSRKAKYLAFIYALYIGFGASIGFHWFSESFAGVVIGTIVGVVVGRSYKLKNASINS
ncbi:MAG: hypothetical protein A3J48_03235 [Candidatus Doudnabacteria bacterium RIFCSPHIGHO2_02_FULL_46_11]|uniref:Phosphatidic acid phosphatase type 2/haloperoxidase domain-containing protein n=1 Tax=Candidatus Doudnabacteria bacterium RIFCSPHIGHO2_02_FULL_46_11 TaxID=1817832 RepID=A0A1F5P8N6_9BACT|nr:MAG: hypothetical protein A3J48_03235 [Candidatus Doudnabacteria bacterium RIFCSPHIGHO2_02_FULL_46_11]